jgi:phosphatidylethanolamine/phosphatidyl-N-methylethanolamine N-methyltransferase
MSALTFLNEFFRNWKTVGAIAPSSPALAARMMESAEVWRAERVLELGPGTGALTQGIADVMPADSSYLGIELSVPFVEQLRKRFPKMRFEQGAAQEFVFDGVLSETEAVDVIISGLPWTAFPECLQEAILDHVLPRLAPGGRFATFAYWGCINCQRDGVFGRSCMIGCLALRQPGWFGAICRLPSCMWPGRAEVTDGQDCRKLS